MRENDGYLYSVKSNQIIPFIWLKTGNNNKNITFHSFSSNNSVYETPKLTFWVTNNVLSSFIMPQCHMSNYFCSLLCTIATLQNEGTIARVMIETQWTYWSDWYFGKYYLIYEGHFRSNITVPVTSVCLIQFSKTIPHFVRQYITYKIIKPATKNACWA